MVLDGCASDLKTIQNAKVIDLKYRHKVKLFFDISCDLLLNQNSLLKNTIMLVSWHWEMMHILWIFKQIFECCKSVSET